MQRYLFFILPFLSSTTLAVAQDRAVAIGLEKMNAVYVGVSTPVTVAVSDIPSEHLQLTVSLGTITRQTGSHFEWQICHFDTNVATLILRDTVNSLLSDTMYYRVKYPPEPHLVGVTKQSHLPRCAGALRPGVSLVLDNFDFDILCRVVEFRFMLIRKGQDAQEVINKGARPNEQLTAILNGLIPGDRVLFYKIKYTVGCDPEIRYHSDAKEYLIRD